MIDNIIILAAGYGKRMLSKKPKVLMDLRGKVILEHVCDIPPKDTSKIVVISDFIRSLVPESIYNREDIVFVNQKDRLGTGDAVKVAVNNPSYKNTGLTVILYGDTPFISFETIKKACNKITKDGFSLVVLSFSCLERNQYGKLIFDEKTNLLKKIEEGIDEGDICNSGFFVIKSQDLKENINKIKINSKGEYYLTDLVEVLYKNGIKTSNLECDISETIGVNTVEDFAKANSFYKRKLCFDLIKKGACFADLEKTSLMFDTEIGDGTYVDESVVFGKNVKVGKNCRIEPFVSLSDCVIGDNCIIESNSVVRDKTILGENSIIKSFSLVSGLTASENCKIGPFSRIRDNTVFDSDVEIGNFVEVKKSKLGRLTKAKHLSYVGNVSSGESCNIAAGTIFCNYDGVNKHNTEMGDRVFIGSQTALVAPLKLGSDVFIAAGSIVKKDLDNDDFFVSKQDAKTLKNTTKKFFKKKKNTPIS